MRLILTLSSSQRRGSALEAQRGSCNVMLSMLCRDIHSKSGSPDCPKGRNCSTTIARRYCTDKDIVSRSTNRANRLSLFRAFGDGACAGILREGPRMTQRNMKLS